MSEAIIRERHFCSKILWFCNIESVKNTNIYSEICDTMIKMKDFYLSEIKGIKIECCSDNACNL